MNAGKNQRSARRWMVVALIVICMASASIAIVRVVNRERGNSRAPVDAHSLFAKKYLPRISFPQKYDGTPSPKARPEAVEKIVRVHSRYWHNFAPVDEARFDYSFRRYHDGVWSPTNWDMDAHVTLRYGRGIQVKGQDAKGDPFDVALNEAHMNMDPDVGDLSSLMLSMFGAYRSWPDKCQYFVDIDEDVEKIEGLSGDRYDVLISMSDSEMPGHSQELHEVKHWFNRETGMLELIQHCDPAVKAAFGYFPYERFKYECIDAVYIPTEILSDFPNKRNRFVESYHDVSVRKHT